MADVALLRIGDVIVAMATSAGARELEASSQWRIAGPLAAWCGGQICRPIVLGFGKWIACLKPRVLMPKVTCSIYSILVSS